MDEYRNYSFQTIPIQPQEAEYRDKMSALRDKQREAQLQQEREAREALYEPECSVYANETELDTLREMQRKAIEYRAKEQECTSRMHRLRHEWESTKLRQHHLGQSSEALNNLLDDVKGDKEAAVQNKIRELDIEASVCVNKRLAIEEEREKLYAKVQRDAIKTKKAILKNLAEALELADGLARRDIELTACVNDAGVSLDEKLQAPDWFRQTSFREGSSDGMPGRRFVDGNSQSGYHRWRDRMIESGVIGS
jgi:hypothetical protein